MGAGGGFPAGAAGYAGASGAGGSGANIGGSTSVGGMSGQGGVTPVEPDPPFIDPACAGLRQFDGDEVYVMGTLSEGSCGSDAIAHWSDPNTALAGFGCYNEAFAAVIRPKDGALIAKDTFGRPRVFNEDACFIQDIPQPLPMNPDGNDGQFNFPCAFVPVYGSGIELAPRGSMAVQCETGWYQGNTALYSGPDEVVAFDGDRFLTRTGVFEIETQTLLPFNGLPLSEPMASRVIETGFWLLLPNPIFEEPPQLWLVDREAVATLLGTYPPPPSIAQPTFVARLAGDGSLFEIATNLSEFSNDLIIRRTLGGESDVIYDEGTDPLVKLHISSLVTGP